MKGTDKQIAFAESVKREILSYISEEIALTQSEHDRGYKHLESAAAEGNAAKIERVTKAMDRFASRIKQLAVAAIITERADDAAFILDNRDCPYKTSNKVTFSKYVSRAVANGYISSEEAEGFEYVPRDFSGNEV